MAGEAIPEAARILAIVDVYDALSHDRVYRPAMPEAETLEILRQGSYTHFDPRLLALFFEHLDEARRINRENPNEAEPVEIGAAAALPIVPVDIPIGVGQCESVS